MTTLVGALTVGAVFIVISAFMQTADPGFVPASLESMSAGCRSVAADARVRLGWG